MKLLMTVLLALTTTLSFAQGRRVNFSEIDSKAAQIDAPTPDSLARLLTTGYSTDLEKVRAIFRWITAHIAYGVPRYGSARFSFPKQRFTELADTALDGKPLNERVAYDVLRKRVAVCNGYARLFKTLCDYAGVRCELVTGYARTNMGSGKFHSNHTWNAVYTDSAWHLVDVTWASGFMTYSDEFVQHFDESFFFPDPKEFIYTHYPEDLQWALLPNPPALREFDRAPFKHSAFIKYKINGYKPTSGVVQASVGDTLQFELETTDADRDAAIAANRYDDDSTLQFPSATWTFLKPATVDGKKVFYQYPVTSDTIEWLNIVYNDDVIMRYRLSIKKNYTAGR